MRAAAAGLFLGLSLLACQPSEPLPDRLISARAVAITPRLSRWRSDEVVVTLRSQSGLTAAKSIRVARLTCAMGDVAQVHARGVILLPDETTCERGARLPHF